MRLIVMASVIIAFAGAYAVPVANASSTSTDGSEQSTTQLPRTVRPTHYAVTIDPDAANLRFKGIVAVNIDVLQPTSRITLNAIDMRFSKVSLQSLGRYAEFAAPRVLVDAEAQTVTFSFGKTIAHGNYVLSMDYTGKIGTQANGLFAIDYDTKDGKKRALYTQFENSDARRLIPCWDEPAYKTTFLLRAIVPGTQMAVSNMPVAQRTDLGHGRSLVGFAVTPKMSTYLLFFASGDFERATAKMDDVELGVITQKGSVSQAAFALESSKAILHEYNDYFGTPYALPKLDNIAAPAHSEFFGAMENWGSIFTFEYALLLDPRISTQSDKQSVFSTQAHEMAHQWFGDLVTMRWWDDLWLNEGFASWMEGRTTQRLHPEWNTTLSEVGVREDAMGRDAIQTTHPVVQHVATVEQASQAFDAITYSKGEAVIRMLEGYVGADAWRAGVRRYIQAHAYGNTATDDLWREVEAAAGKPITAIAHDFTLQPGVPLIRVEQATCSDGNTILNLSQGEFTKDRADKTPLLWRVPVIAQPMGTTTAIRTLVANGRAAMTIPGCGVIVINAGQTGYYRTLYTPAQFAAIKAHFGELAPIDQLGVIADTWALGTSGLLPMSDYLDLIQATPANADPQVWGKISADISMINDYYEGDPGRQAKFRTYAIARLAPVLATIGWLASRGEFAPVTILRNQLILALSALGDPAVINEAHRRYEAQHSDPSALPAALRKTILAVIARHADAITWEHLHAMAISEKTPLVKDDLYSQLSSTEDETLARQALNLALTDEPGATNSAGMIAGVAVLHPTLAFDFVIEHLTEVDNKIDSTSRSRYYPSLGDNSLDPNMINKIKAYSDAHIAGSARRASDTSISNITYRIMVHDKRLPAIDAWLKRALSD